jgi:hypothetical protein
MTGISYRKAVEKGLLTDKDRIRLLATVLAKVDEIKITAVSFTTLQTS